MSVCPPNLVISVAYHCLGAVSVCRRLRRKDGRFAQAFAQRRLDEDLDDLVALLRRFLDDPRARLGAPTRLARGQRQGVVWEAVEDKDEALRLGRDVARRLDQPFAPIVVRINLGAVDAKLVLDCAAPSCRFHRWWCCC